MPHARWRESSRVSFSCHRRRSTLITLGLQSLKKKNKENICHNLHFWTRPLGISLVETCIVSGQRGPVNLLQWARRRQKGSAQAPSNCRSDSGALDVRLRSLTLARRRGHDRSIGPQSRPCESVTEAGVCVGHKATVSVMVHGKMDQAPRPQCRICSWALRSRQLLDSREGQVLLGPPCRGKV